MKLSSIRYIAAGLEAFVARWPLFTLDRFARQSWSQEGEDLILARFMEPRTRGFYVDVGAHDPFRFSNTAYFYRAGWSGLNIEADPDGVQLIRRYRRRDVTINGGAASVQSEMTLFRFNEPALNTFDSELARKRVENGGYKIVEQVGVSVDRLENILSRHLAPNQKIDFMTVDVEGLDLDVLKSNDWVRFRPDIVVTEIFNLELLAIGNEPTTGFMNTVGYRPVAKAANSVFFAAKEVL